MSSTTPTGTGSKVNRDQDGNRLYVTLSGSFSTSGVVATMARARHSAEQCAHGFTVIIDARQFSTADSGALPALAEWERVLEFAGARAVIRIGTGETISNAKRAAPDRRTAERELAE